MGFSKRGWNEVWELDEKVVYLSTKTKNSGSEKRHGESERILRQRQWKIKAVEVWSTVVLSSHRHLWCGRGLNLMHFKNRSPPINYQLPTQNQSNSSGRVGAIWEDSRTWRQLDWFFFSALTSSNRSPPLVCFGRSYGEPDQIYWKGVGPSRFAGTAFRSSQLHWGKSHFWETIQITLEVHYLNLGKVSSVSWVVSFFRFLVLKWQKKNATPIKRDPSKQEKLAHKMDHSLKTQEKTLYFKHPHVSPRCVFRDYLHIWKKNDHFHPADVLRVPKKTGKNLPTSKSPQAPLMAETCPASLAWPPQPEKWGHQATKKKRNESWCEGWSECSGGCCCGGGGVGVFKGLVSCHLLLSELHPDHTGPQKSTNINHIKQPSIPFFSCLKKMDFPCFPCETFQVTVVDRIPARRSMIRNVPVYGDNAGWNALTFPMKPPEASHPINIDNRHSWWSPMDMVVEPTPLKNMSEIGSKNPRIRVKIKKDSKAPTSIL